MSVLDKYIDKVKCVCSKYNDCTEKTIRELLAIVDSAMADLKSGSIVEEEFECIMDEVYSYDIGPVKAVSLIMDKDMPRNRIKWLAKNEAKLHVLYSLSTMVLKSTVRNMLEEHFRGLSDSADMKMKLAKCKTGCDLARCWLPYPMMTKNGLVYKLIDDCDNAIEMASILSIMSSDAKFMKLSNKSHKYGRGKFMLTDKIELMKRGKTPIQPYMYFNICKTGEVAYAKVEDILDELRGANII